MCIDLDRSRTRINPEGFVVPLRKATRTGNLRLISSERREGATGALRRGRREVEHSNLFHSHDVNALAKLVHHPNRTLSFFPISDEPSCLVRLIHCNRLGYSRGIGRISNIVTKGRRFYVDILVR